VVRLSGCKSGDTVSKLVTRFNQEGLAALQPRYGHHPKLTYGVNERERILREPWRKPEPSQDGTASWSLRMLCQAIRKAPDGLPKVSEDTIRSVLLEAGFNYLSFAQINGNMLLDEKGSEAIR
jgi:transposase